MSFYSADALPRAITDLEGVLCAGGVMTLFGRGTAARLAIVLGAPPAVVEVPDDGEAAGDREAVPVPDDEAAGDGEPVPVPDGEAAGDGEAVPVDDVDTVPAPDDQAAPGPARDHRIHSGVSGPDGAPHVPGDHASTGDWDEGVDEIPDDEFPVRYDDRPPPDEPPTTDRTEPAGTPDNPPSPATEPLEGPRPGVVTPDPVVEWRAHALCCAFRGRGVPADVERLPDGRPVVRSAYRADLVGLATAWQAEDGTTTVPEDIELDGPRLRLWVLAAGRRRGRAYTLGLDPHARATHEPLLTACQRAGLGATLAGDEDDPVVEIVGQRRQRRLAELVGDRPRSLAEGVWPE